MTKTRPPATTGLENPIPTGVRAADFQTAHRKFLEDARLVPHAVAIRAAPLRPIVGSYRNHLCERKEYEKRPSDSFRDGHALTFLRTCPPFPAMQASRWTRSYASNRPGGNNSENGSPNGPLQIRRVFGTRASADRPGGCSDPDNVPVGDAPNAKPSILVIRRSYRGHNTSHVRSALQPMSRLRVPRTDRPL